MPNITFEIDPNHASAPSSNYSSLVWVPDGAGVLNRWSDYLDATTTGDWYLTNGTVGGAIGCTQANMCSFDTMQAGLADATIYTAAVGKGRDSRWVGAVDGLRINDEVFDFELFGTVTRAP